MSENKIKLYTFPLSGHAHRIELALNLLDLPHELQVVDLAKGEQRSDWFKELNPQGKVPVLVDGDVIIADSTAILTYLAAKYDNGTWVPADPVMAAEVQKWFVQANTALATGPAAARLITLFGAGFDPEATIAAAHTFLEYLDNALAGRDFLVGNAATFADVAIYTYTAHAPEGHVSLEKYENILRWIASVEALPGFKGMPKTDVHAAA